MDGAPCSSLADGLCLLLGMCCWSAGPALSTVVYAALTAAVMFLKLFQSADRLVRCLQRDFNLFWIRSAFRTWFNCSG